jgi:hypothetical protein
MGSIVQKVRLDFGVVVVVPLVASNFDFVVVVVVAFAFAFVLSFVRFS